MNKLVLVAFIGISALLSGCCHCNEDFPVLKVEFKNFSPSELKTVYLVSDALADTCFSCVDTLNGSMSFFASAHSQHQILSDSIPLLKTIQVNKIRSESSRFFLCDPCRTITGIDYELDGNKYTSEPIVITK